jgi:hypothetical protein
MERHGQRQVLDGQPPLDDYHSHLLDRQHLQEEAALRARIENSDKPAKGAREQLDNTGKVCNTDNQASGTGY